MTTTTRWRRGQRGVGTIGLLLIMVVVAVAGFALLKVGGAYMDVSGFRKDLEENISGMQYNCIHSDCEELFMEELDDLRVLKGRDLDIDWDNLDWLGADNELVVKGWKIVDFRFWKYYHYFTLEIPTHQ
ncbi:MAG: hypothetical protein ABIK09_05380 [Pseudomonadota bacterium]